MATAFLTFHYIKSISGRRSKQAIWDFNKVDAYKIRCVHVVLATRDSSSNLR